MVYGPDDKWVVKIREEDEPVRYYSRIQAVEDMGQLDLRLEACDYINVDRSALARAFIQIQVEPPADRGQVPADDGRPPEWLDISIPATPPLNHVGMFTVNDLHQDAGEFERTDGDLFDDVNTAPTYD
ncbi:uncharacterized protein Z518_09626 [Rhinocladiella mackenziei CBS 650.93]|uniref:Uncharacterized protein n=1 Tax=Rhinocladiella mackenziei CBS 650.93 TaxID=1442369 RepID=A0A0D2IB97_9EURO|nr:uncharacterized protein Z518_09626 [Rhinocladiella mackenziei CBS 650.93]KIX00561.1 hypothetical protein Z518_09626 [Rhinocladiella mackenziei CBS 650.93]